MCDFNLQYRCEVKNCEFVFGIFSFFNVRFSSQKGHFQLVQLFGSYYWLLFHFVIVPLSVKNGLKVQPLAESGRVGLHVES